MTEPNHIVRFGACEANIGTRELRRNGVKVKLQDQPFQVLAALLENAGEVVTKEELKDRIWAEDTFVDFDRSLATAVNKVRQALGDSAANPRFIETIPKQGYRFIYPLNAGRPGEAGSDGSAVPPHPAALLGKWAFAAMAVLLLAGGSYWIFRGRLDPANPRFAPPKSVTALTHYLGAEIHPAFAPDGSRIAFAWDSGERPGQFDIYVQVVGESNPRALTSNPADETGPAWSPDGRHIAFLRSVGTDALPVHDLVLIPATGGPETVLIEAGVRGSWSSRGRGLAWSADSAHILFPSETDDGLAQAIWALNLETRDRHRITDPAANETDRTPALRPDGSGLLFARGLQFSTEIFELSLDPDLRPAGPPTPLTSEPGTLNRSPVVWNDAILYERRRINDRFAEIHVLGGEAGALVRGADPTVSGATNRLAFTQAEQAVGIWRVTLDDEHRAVGAPQRLIASSGFDLFAEYSPDGAKIAFQSDRDGENVIWICDADGGNLRRLTSQGFDGSPTWSPDGKTIVFDSSRDGAFSVYVVDADGGKPRRVVQSGFAGPWSADGAWIYYTALGPEGTQIWRIRPDGSDGQAITKGGGRAPQLGRGDGFIYYRAPDKDVWRVPLKGGEEEPVVTGLIEADSSEPAKGGVYYATKSGPHEPYDILFWDNATGKTHPIGVTVPRMTWQQSQIGLALSPDERWLLFQKPEPLRSDIMLAEGFE